MAEGARDLPVGEARIAVYTSPHATADLDPEPALITLINRARRSVLFGVYSFTLPDVAAALIAAARRGVTVRGLGDAGSWGYRTSQFSSLVTAGIDVRQWGASFELMHLKVAVVDGVHVSWGSWNWTTQAEKVNQEVMTIAGSTHLAGVLSAQLQTAYAAGRTVS